MRRLGQSIVEQRTMLVAVRRVVRRAVLAALLAGAPLPVAMAQADEAGATVTVSKLEALLAWAPQHPAVKAAQAGLAAAEAQLRAARSPVRLEVSSSLTQLDVDEIDLAPEIPGMQALDKTLLSVTAGVSLRPFAFGDIADLVDQREVAVAQARLDLSESLVAIQVRTLEAAYELELASAGVTVAEQGLELAKEALAATELRVERGAATERELREAGNGRAEAENLLLAARENRALAEQALRSLVGPAELALPVLTPGALSLPAPSGEPVDVLRAGLQVRLAELAPRGAQRALLPTAQAGYSWNLGDHDTLSVSIESRTLQPNVSFSHEAQGRAFPQTEIRGALTVGVAWSLSPEAFAALDAAEAQLEAARLGLEATRQGAELQTRALANALAQAERAEVLAENRYADARARLEESRARVEVGIAAPLELQSDALSLTRAQVDLHAARLSVLRSTLDLYEFYALPLTATPEADAR